MQPLLLLAAQAASPAAVPPAPPTSFSILQPVPNEPCVPRGAAKAENPDDIIVCGKPLPSQRLPYPNDVVPDGPRPSNPYLRGSDALALEASPCAAVSGGCQVGFDFLGIGTALVRLVQKAIAPGSCCERPGEGTSFGLLATDAVNGIGRSFRKKPDKSKRVPIPLDETPPETFGKVLP